MTVLPYKDQNDSKKQQVATMFNNISKRYDLLNRMLSAGIDIYWRKRAIAKLAASKPAYLLDVATGTGDLALEAMRQLQPQQIVGVDISEGMLAVGREKMQARGLADRITLEVGDSEALRFPDNTFDAVTVAFGVRNFEHLEQGLSDIYRVLKPGGTLVVLEFSKPEYFPFKQLYNFYFKHILPLIGRMVSKDQSAYTYLPESVQEFPYGSNFLQILDKVGYQKTTCTTLTFGISSIYTGVK